MLGYLIGGSIASLIMYAAHKRVDEDIKVLLHIFDNLNYKVGNRLPKLIKKSKRDRYTEYVFSVPHGLIDKEFLQPTIQKTFNRRAEVEFAGKLIVNIFHKNLPTNINYNWAPSKKWTVPLGLSDNGMIYHNFDKIPHMTVAGTTRYGKTVLLKLILSHLINNNQDVEFYILDLKGGLEFGRYDKLKPIKNVSSNVEEAHKALSSVLSLIKTDMRYFKSKGYNDIANTDINRRRFIIVDEGAQLDKHCQDEISKITQMGGAIGYRLIFATQYPTADILPRQVKQNADAKISFRLPNGTASRVAIDDMGAEEIRHVGRAIYKTAYKEVIQVPYIKDEDITKELRGLKNDKTEREDGERRTDPLTFG